MQSIISDNFFLSIHVEAIIRYSLKLPAPKTKIKKKSLNLSIFLFLIRRTSRADVYLVGVQPLRWNVQQCAKEIVMLNVRVHDSGERYQSPSLNRFCILLPVPEIR